MFTKEAVAAAAPRTCNIIVRTPLLKIKYKLETEGSKLQCEIKISPDY